MANTFLPYSVDQGYLLPQAPREWLPEGHLALFVEETVGVLDMRRILERYEGGRGPRAYHPKMLLNLLIYGYCTGVYSSRKIAKGCETDLAFRMLSGSQFPDFRTMSDFRKEHLEAFEGMFVEVLRLCREAGLAHLGHLSLDGSKYQASASKHKAMSYGRIQEAEPQLEAEVKELLRRAEAMDEAEDAEYGEDNRGDELPEELCRREGRLEKIREAKRRLEERAKKRARDRAQAREAALEDVAKAEATAVPSPKEQSNFTDPDSRIMKTSLGWVQGYNAQVLVNEEGIILAQEVSAQHADSVRLKPVLQQAQGHMEVLRVPEEERRSGVFTADAGYCSEANLEWLEQEHYDAYVATGRERHYGGGILSQATRTPRRTAMREKLRTPQGRAIYARRKAMTEPVHGLIKQARGFRRFLLRGLGKVQGEFTLVALTHNLLKLWRSQKAAIDTP